MAVLVPVAAPARSPRLGGIRAAASWVTNARIGAAEGLVYLSNGCTFPQPAIGLCYGESVEDEKEGVGIDQFDGIGEPFALYGGVDCFIGPGNETDFPTRARQILSDGEDRAVEDRLSTWAAAGHDVGDSADVVEAIAALEQYADANYLGRPILLLSRGDAVRASAKYAIVYSLDGLPYTVNGTPVVASGMIDDGTYSIVGATTVVRTEVFDINTINWKTNHDFAVAEATYTILVDCDFRATSTGA
jgi:hypothetical protein